MGWQEKQAATAKAGVILDGQKDDDDDDDLIVVRAHPPPPRPPIRHHPQTQTSKHLPPNAPQRRVCLC